LGITIREFKEGDQGGINEIENKTFPEPWPISLFNYAARKNPSLFIVAEKDEAIVAYLVGELREIMFSGISHMSRVGHVLNIAVDSKYRQRGIGSLLLEEIENRFRDVGATKVTLEVRESNSTAQSFYINKGFTSIGRVRAYYPDEDAIVMSKTL
jgi:ribosomal-protein-alanine N-acetyltransferase